MDNLERRLAEDAARIEARVSPELDARLQAALRAPRVAPAAHRGFGTRLWLAASLTGVAAAVVAIMLVNLRVNLPPNLANEPSPQRADAVAYSVPEYVSELERQFPLRAKTAQMTTPLEDELKHLRSDLEKARENVEQDLEFTF